jgi:hypothetical protein
MPIVLVNSRFCKGACELELPDEGGIALPDFGSSDVFEAMAGAEAVRGAEGGWAAFRVDASAGEDEKAVMRLDGDGGQVIRE